MDADITIAVKRATGAGIHKGRSKQKISNMVTLALGTLKLKG